jgi:hypothetical protein
LDLNSLNLVHKYAVIMKKSVLLIALGWCYPCSNGRILEEEIKTCHQVRLIKWEGQVKAGITFQLNEDGLKQALSSIHSNTAKNSGIEITIPNLNGC